MANIGEKGRFSVGFKACRGSEAIEMTRFGAIVQYPRRQPQGQRLAAPLGRAHHESTGDARQIRLAIEASKTQLLSRNIVVWRQVAERNGPAAALMIGIGQKFARCAAQ